MNRRRFLSFVGRLAAVLPFAPLAKLLPDTRVPFTPKYYSVSIPEYLEDLPIVVAKGRQLGMSTMTHKLAVLQLYKQDIGMSAETLARAFEIPNFEEHS